MTGIQRPTASGIRISGDDYQHLLTWRHALDMLNGRVIKLGLEVDGIHNLDDLIVLRHGESPAFHQIKFASNQSSPLTAEWFTDRGSAATSILEKFWNSFGELTVADQRPQMILHTNRLLEPGVLAKNLDGKNDKLIPLLCEGGARSDNGRLRASWANHLNISEEQLMEMLTYLEIRAARASLHELSSFCISLMDHAGLVGSEPTVQAGMGSMRRLIRDGHRELTLQHLQEIIRREGFARVTPRATLTVQQIARVPAADIATASVDWVSLFRGASARERRQLIDPADWNATLRPSLTNAATTAREAGTPEVVVNGAMRLSTGLLAGYELGSVTGTNIIFRQGPDEWNSTGDRQPAALAHATTVIGAGNDLAIAVAISADLSQDVTDYVRSAGLSVGTILTLTSDTGIGREAIKGAPHARGLADVLLDTIRTEAREADRIHLFLSAPIGLALLLGHIWNRLPATTQLYDDLGRPGAYTPTYELV